MTIIRKIIARNFYAIQNGPLYKKEQQQSTEKTVRIFESIQCIGLFLASNTNVTCFSTRFVLKLTAHC